MHVVLHPPNVSPSVPTSVDTLLQPQRPAASGNGGQVSVRNTMENVLERALKYAQDGEGDSAGGVIQSISAAGSCCGDEGFGVFFRYVEAHSARLCGHLRQLDLSWCALELPTWRGGLRSLIEYGGYAPFLEAVHLIGNFRCSLGVAAIHNPANSAVKALANDMARVWESHAVLSVLATDPWICSPTLRAIRVSRQRRARDAATSRVVVALRAEVDEKTGRPTALHRASSRMSAVRASATLRGLGERVRDSVFVISREDVAKPLMDAAIRSQLSLSDAVADSVKRRGLHDEDVNVAATEKSAAERQQQLLLEEFVAMQVAEHERRAKVVRLEEAAWNAICSEAGTQAVRIQRHCSHRVRAMEELEEEVRSMLLHRESDARRKLLAKVMTSRQRCDSAA